MATPHVAGVVALMKGSQALADPGPDRADPQGLGTSAARGLLQGLWRRPGGCHRGGASRRRQCSHANASGDPTPKPTPQPTPDDGVASPLVNGDFESRVGWNDPYGLITTQGPARSGSGVASLGGVGRRGERAISQTFTLSRNATRLDLALQVRSNEVIRNAVDRLSISIDGREVASASNVTAKDRWLQQSGDISAFAGRTVTLKISSNEDFLLPTRFYVDDLVVR